MCVASIYVCVCVCVCVYVYICIYIYTHKYIYRAVYWYSFCSLHNYYHNTHQQFTTSVTHWLKHPLTPKQEIFNYYYSPKFDRGRTFLAFVLLIGEWGGGLSRETILENNVHNGGSWAAR